MCGSCSVSVCVLSMIHVYRMQTVSTMRKSRVPTLTSRIQLPPIDFRPWIPMLLCSLTMFSISSLNLHTKLLVTMYRVVFKNLLIGLVTVQLEETRCLFSVGILWHGTKEWSNKQQLSSYNYFYSDKILKFSNNKLPIFSWKWIFMVKTP